MERFLQIFMILVLAVIGISCALSIRMHYRVWRYAPPKERLDIPDEPRSRMPDDPRT